MPDCFVTNIGSQMAANRCGYMPYWVDMFGAILEEDRAIKYTEEVVMQSYSENIFVSDDLEVIRIL